MSRVQCFFAISAHVSILYYNVFGRQRFETVLKSFINAVSLCKVKLNTLDTSGNYLK